jgi:hypothetical protein
MADGIEVYYSTSGGDPSVTNIRLLHDVDTTPIMKDINNNGYYYFVIPSFISEGRNVYDFVKDFWDSDTNMDLGNYYNYIRCEMHMLTSYNFLHYISKTF